MTLPRFLPLSPTSLLPQPQPQFQTRSPPLAPVSPLVTLQPKETETQDIQVEDTRIEDPFNLGLGMDEHDLLLLTITRYAWLSSGRGLSRGFLAAARALQDHIQLGWLTDARSQKIKKYGEGIRNGTLVEPWKDEIWEREN
ncbi:hypothetical protein H0H92_009538, partial [Tricholoma furcatifolium]